MQPVSIMRANAVLWAALFLYWILASRRVARTERAEGHAARVRHIALLAVAFICLFGDKLEFPPLSDRFLPEANVIGWLGDLLTFAGLSFAIWARIHLGRYWSGRITVKAGHRLITSGPYRLVRHPIYTGVLVGVIGSSVALGELRGLASILIVAGAYAVKIKAEEAMLRKALGREYEDYRSTVPALIPFVL